MEYYSSHYDTREFLKEDDYTYCCMCADHQPKEDMDLYYFKNGGVDYICYKCLERLERGENSV